MEFTECQEISFVPHHAEVSQNSAVSIQGLNRHCEYEVYTRVWNSEASLTIFKWWYANALKIATMQGR
jgi:hypothetical protein